MCAVRPELAFEDVPAPRTLAPFAIAVAATARVGGIGSRLGPFRAASTTRTASAAGWARCASSIYIRADLEPEIAADPMLGEVAWSWLTGVHSTPAHLVTRSAQRYRDPRGHRGFGAKREDPQATGFELRASWSPVGMAGPASWTWSRPGASLTSAESAQAGLDGHLAAWCGAICAAAGCPRWLRG